MTWRALIPEVEKIENGQAGVEGVLVASWVDRGNRRTAEQRHPDRLTDTGHRVRGEHPRTASFAGTGGTLNRPELLVGHRADGVRADCFEDRRDVERFTVEFAGQDRPPVEEDARYRRVAPPPISMPGNDLSHPARVTIASNRSACITTSTESAITSRDTSDARIPSWPIEMPSDTAIVTNSNGTPPASRTATFVRLASRSSGRLHGVTSFQLDATPIWGFVMSPSVRPSRAASRVPAHDLCPA